MGLGDMVLVTEMQRHRVGDVLAKMIFDNVFGDTIEPGIKRRFTPVGRNRTIGFQPSLLCQVFGDFGIGDATGDMTQ